MEYHTDLPYWLALRRAGLGSTNFSLLLPRFSDIGSAWKAPPEAIARAGLDAQFVRAFERARANFDGESELNLLEKAGARAITWLDPAFPPSLREIPQSPPVLFVRGAPGPEFPQAMQSWAHDG